MTRLADLNLADRDGVVVAELAGEVDLSNVADVDDALSQAAPSEKLGLVIDMAALRHIDSAGIRMLFDLRRRLARRRQELALTVPPQSRPGRGTSRPAETPRAWRRPHHRARERTRPPRPSIRHTTAAVGDVDANAQPP